ncbi:MAG: phosphotransferase family protein [Planctomycetes bacterium]|nr:phosphotransferase family protein [Planctomycetota bacterium]
MSTFSNPGPALEAFLTQALDSPVRVTAARQLTGGASRATWAVDVEVASGPGQGKLALVLRADLGGTINDDALSREQEFQLLQAVHRAGVLVPRPRWLCTDASVLGVPFFLMDRVEGESIGRRIVREPALAEARGLLPRQMGEQLLRIHAMPLDSPDLEFLPRPQGDSPARAAVEAVARQLERLGEPHPVLELALRWLLNHAPACEERVLCHGDFRVGNLMVGPDGLRAVFDWEFAHLGDPAEDLAWPCVRAWRYGKDALRLGGVGQPDEFLDAYAGNTHRHRELEGRLAYWEILGNCRWAVGCIQQADRHLAGQAPSVELASLGRRTAEMELELLDLIERSLSCHTGLQ